MDPKFWSDAVSRENSAPVVKDINLSIPGGQKFGLVGRTGRYVGKFTKFL
jgi:ABC-type multidrug transport system fused ATPase/permease subunit